MEYTQNLNLAKPSRNTDDIADINVVSENFQKIDDFCGKVFLKENVLSRYKKNPEKEDVYNAPVVNQMVEDAKKVLGGDISNALKGSVVFSKKQPCLLETSPIEHLISVVSIQEEPVDPDTTVYVDVFGTNLLNTYEYSGVGAVGIKLNGSFPMGEYVFSCDVSGSVSETLIVDVLNENNNVIEHIEVPNGEKISAKFKATEYFWYIAVWDGSKNQIVLRNAQLEAGSVATPFEEYKYSYVELEVRENGVCFGKVPSIYPKTTIFPAPNTSGVIEYNKDINVAFAQLGSKKKLDYSVSFYVDDDLYQSVEVKKGNWVNAPVIEPTSENGSFAGWQNNGVVVEFPYPPENDVDLDALFVVSEVDRLYANYNVDKTTYPYVLICLNKRYDSIRIYFFQKVSANSLNAKTSKILFSQTYNVDETTFPDYGNYSEIVALAINTIPVSLVETTGAIDDCKSSDYVVWTNAEVYTGSGYNEVHYIT
jgi:hypothetical protein